MQVEHDKNEVTSNLVAIVEPVLIDALKPRQGDKLRAEYNCNFVNQLVVEAVEFIHETDKEICAIGEKDGLMRVIDVSEFVAWHPLRDEMEVAKEKQAVEIANIIDQCYESGVNTIDTVKHLQDNDMLAEIILPLDK